jgi:hypothetical protein
MVRGGKEESTEKAMKNPTTLRRRSCAPVLTSRVVLS